MLVTVDSIREFESSGGGIVQSFYYLFLPAFALAVAEITIICFCPSLKSYRLNRNWPSHDEPSDSDTLLQLHSKSELLRHIVDAF